MSTKQGDTHFKRIVVLASGKNQVWTIIDPLQRDLIIVAQDAFSREMETYAGCSSDHGAIFLGALFSLGADWVPSSSSNGNLEKNR